MSRPAPITKRPLLDNDDAARLEDLFKVLANDTRLRILHTLLRASEATVGEVAHAVEMSTQAVSNQLQRMGDRGIVSARRDGNHIHYRVVDPCIEGLMTLGVCLIEEQLHRARQRP